MSSNRETPVLIASLLITAGLIGGGLWWFSRSGDFNLGSLMGGNTPSATTPNNSDSTLATTGVETFAQVDSVPAGVFAYGGSTTWAPVRGTVDSILTQVHPSFQLRYTNPIGVPPGSGTGIEMLLSNQISFSQSSRPLNAEERQRAEQQGYSLKEIPVAIEGLAIAVHPDLAVEGLTLTQLRDIYLGSLTNWSQVGGPNLAITAVSRPGAGGTVEFFVDTVLGGSPLAASVRTAGTTTEALRLVSDTPGAIYYASAPEVVGQCTVKPIALGHEANALVQPYAEPYVPPSACPDQRNQLNREGFRSGDYPITRRMFVILREDGSADQQAGEAYAALLLSRQGQDLLNEAGFVPIR
ncbi:PstS family phosphate ABC transporter substrate-binding protein [Leptolyngbya sp. PCC 6406]|uniref:PstS family phosphate ABC transporter substrate-binding protein n=1 Tax=Leptolyngbya sp. PCC 6406 TaxID=1173264 RepID=UPI0002ABAC3E|nr:PstS family phosphate ABC transporter substrate-binding protein [Leptolyngbya sp. PCC 6406]